MLLIPSSVEVARYSLKVVGLGRYQGREQGIQFALRVWMLYNRPMAYKDPLDERARAARRKHYDNNKQQYFDRRQALREELREIVKEAKNKPCMDCGVSYPSYVMDLDHRDPTDKVKEVGKFILAGNRKGLLLEIAKCDVVCSNCHRLRTHQAG